MAHRLELLVIPHTHRLPPPTGPAGEGAVAARQFDAALMSVGFKLSAQPLERLPGLPEGTVVDTAVRTLVTVQEMADDLPEAFHVVGVRRVRGRGRGRPLTLL